MIYKYKADKEIIEKSLDFSSQIVKTMPYIRSHNLFLNNFTSKISEYFSEIFLKNSGLEIKQGVDWNIYGRKQKSFSPDLVVRGKSLEFDTSVSVKSCSDSGKFANTWTWQHEHDGRLDGIFKRDKETDWNSVERPIISDEISIAHDFKNITCLCSYNKDLEESCILRKSSGTPICIINHIIPIKKLFDIFKFPILSNKRLSKRCVYLPDVEKIDCLVTF